MSKTEHTVPERANPGCPKSPAAAVLRTRFALSVAALLALGSGTVMGRLATAADVEAFELQNLRSSRPNVLFVLDSTSTMRSTSSLPSYDHTRAYPDADDNNPCDPAYAYFSTDGTLPTSCKASRTVGRIRFADLSCDAETLLRLEETGVSETAATLNPQRRRYLEKKRQGKNDILAPLAPSPAEGNTVYCSSYVGDDAPPQADFSVAQPTTLWSANYINYFTWVKSQPPEEGEARIEKIKAALLAIAKKYRNDINIGLIRTSTNGQPDPDGSGEAAASGGPVIFDVSPGTDPALYSAYHGGATRLDDFEWTLYRRVACAKAGDCAPPPAVEPPLGPEDCRPTIPGADCVELMYPNGGKKPLAESMYEAALYFRGDVPDFGFNSFVDPGIRFDSVPSSMEQCPADRNANMQCYISPAVGDECQQNYIILLTDGVSEGDGSRDLEITNLLEDLPEQDIAVNNALAARYDKVSGFNKNDCEIGGVWSENAVNPSNCIDDAAFYLHTDPTLNVRTFAIGFQLSLSGKEEEAKRMLNQVAEAGGTGEMIDSRDPDRLGDILDNIVAQILTSNTSFTAPSVTINAFNRTQNLNDLYMAVFATERKRKWEGNVKKYSILPMPNGEAQIVDWSGNNAIDGNEGFFLADSSSLWMKGAKDGNLAPVGGAAAQIPYFDLNPADPRDGRTILVDSGGDLVQLRELKNINDVAATRQIFGLNGFPDGEVLGQADVLVDWLYGIDTYDEYPPRIDKDGKRIDGNGDSTENPKRLMGDPLHSRPAVVVYGRDDDKEDAVVFITTNEGLLHALDARTGIEKWAFAPRELLYRLDLLRDLVSETDLKDRRDSWFYGLDGTVRVLRIDRDRNGPIEPERGDKVFLYFGMRRGGSSYYALDVTSPDALPKLMWGGPFALPDGAQSWSNPVVGETIRSNIADGNYGVHDGFNNGHPENRYVVLIGGGFDTSNDLLGFQRDTKGNKIYMLDAVSGEILWSAGPADDPNVNHKLDLGLMRHSITGDIRALDLSGDRFIDRMYAADLGGQVWRFDVQDGARADNLVAGGVMASVGGEQDPDTDRRFYYAPDISEIRCNGRVFYNVAIGSGDRENPVSDTLGDADPGTPEIEPKDPVENAFYSFRDYLLRTRVETGNYKSVCPAAAEGEILPPCFETIVDGPGTTLVDVTDDASAAVGGDSAGWKLRLTQEDNGILGEKSLAESRTFAERVFFTTYAPHTPIRGSRAKCGDEVGVNRLYTVSACDARPAPLFAVEVPGEPAPEDRSIVLAQGSIAPEVVFVFPSPADPNCVGKACRPDPVCLVGLESCGSSPGSRPVRTFWRERGAE
jgi:type IV pilus assembly protein PilY1